MCVTGTSFVIPVLPFYGVPTLCHTALSKARLDRAASSRALKSKVLVDHLSIGAKKNGFNTTLFPGGPPPQY